MVTVRIPAPSSMLLSNLLGAAGLVAIIVAIGLLTDWRWSVLATGVFAVALAVLAQLGEPVAKAAATSTELSLVPRHRAA